MFSYHDFELEIRDIARGFLGKTVENWPTARQETISLQAGHLLKQSLLDHGHVKVLTLQQQQRLRRLKAISFEALSDFCDDPESLLENSLHSKLGSESIITSPDQLKGQQGAPDVLPVCKRLQQLMNGVTTPRPITTARIAVSPGFECFQKEDYNCQSFYFLHKGKARIWLIVAPRHADKLEAYLSEATGLESCCTQFVAHQRALVAPSMLRKWGIQFTIFVQNAGQAFLLDYNVYFYAFDAGPNFLEKKPWCDDTWLVPPSYRFCSHTCGAESDPASPMFCDQLEDSSDVSVLDEDPVQELEALNNNFTRPRSVSVDLKAADNSQGLTATGRDISIMSDDFPSSQFHHSTLHLPTQDAYFLDLEHSEIDPSNPAVSIASSSPSIADAAPACVPCTTFMSTHTPAEEPTEISDDTPITLTPRPAIGDGVAQIFNESDDWEGDLSEVLKTLHDSELSDVRSHIDQLIQYGIKYKDFINWPFSERPNDVPGMLRRFCPNMGQESWLNGDAVNQVLAAMIHDRESDMFIDSYKVASFLERDELPTWISMESMDRVLLPVNRDNVHWVLIHLDLKQHIVVVHEAKIIPEAEWALRYTGLDINSVDLRFIVVCTTLYNPNVAIVESIDH